jgi:UDP-N-acetylglucosamine acyltransferase
MSTIHPMAYVDPAAEIGADCYIGPFCYVGAAVRLGAGNRLLNNVTLSGPAVLGDGNVFHPHCVIGGPPQDIAYKGEQTNLVIGDRNIFRECVTVNRGTLKQDAVTTLGSDNLLMACSHVGHDATVEDDCILVNNALLAGHVKIEKHAIIGGASAMHHYTTVGQYAYIGGMTRIVHDVPPFMKYEGHPARVRGVNEVGLSRHGFSPEVVEQLNDAYKRLFRHCRTFTTALAEMEANTNGMCPEVAYLLEFLRATASGKHGRAREALRRA